MNQQPPSLDYDAVEQRLRFARKRAQDLATLNGGNLLNAEQDVRQQLIQEFFFHLLGAVDYFAAYVDQERGTGLGVDRATIGKLIGLLPHTNIPGTDPLGPALRALYAKVNGEPLPADPYGDDGLLFRAFNYRHHVTHRRPNPWLFRVGSDPPVSLVLDPREGTGQGPNHSMYSYNVELQDMLTLISQRIAAANGLL